MIVSEPPTSDRFKYPLSQGEQMLYHVQNAIRQLDIVTNGAQYAISNRLGGPKIWGVDQGSLNRGIFSNDATAEKERNLEFRSNGILYLNSKPLPWFIAELIIRYLIVLRPLQDKYDNLVYKHTLLPFGPLTMRLEGLMELCQHSTLYKETLELYGSHRFENNFGEFQRIRDDHFNRRIVMDTNPVDTYLQNPGTYFVRYYKLETHEILKTMKRWTTTTS